MLKRLQLWKFLFSWERLTQKIYILSKIQERSHFKVNVRDIWKVDIGTIRWDFRSVSNQLGGGGNKKIFQHCTDPSGQEIIYLRALRGRSGRNPILPSSQDNVLIPNNFFEYIYLDGCAVSVHSITNSGLIAGGQNSSKEKQTVFFTIVNPMNKDHRDPQELDLTKPRLALYKQKRKVHQDTVYWVDIQLAQRKGLKLHQTRSNAISFTIHSQVVVSRKLLWWMLEKSHGRKYICHFSLLQRFLPKIIGWKNWIQKSLLEQRHPMNPP